MEKIKRLFKSASSRNGSYSVGMIALVTAIVIVVNLIAGQLPEGTKYVDVSDSRIYEITDTSKEYLADLEHEVTFTVYAEKDSVDERIRTFVERYAALSDKISVEWVDPVLHPAELTENNVTEDNILVACEETGKDMVVTFDDILVVDEYTYYMTGSSNPTEFDGEGQLTGAVYYVTNEEQKKIYCTSGHGEAAFSDSVSELLDKNGMETSELNLLMENEIPEDCDLLFLYAPSTDITEDEKEEILSYMAEGGKVFVILGEMEGEASNLNAVLNEYGMEMANGYIADMERCYQGNYYYIFPEILASDEMADGLSSDMVLLVDAHGFTVGDAARDTITVSEIMKTSENGYAVTEETQEKGTYTLAAVATEEVSASIEETSEETDTSAEETETDTEEETSEGEDTKESRLTVVSAETFIDSQVAEAFSSLENYTLFMNMVSGNFEDVQNIAVEPKSLEVTYNTPQYAGFISLAVIFVIPVGILIFGFCKWWKRRKA